MSRSSSNTAAGVQPAGEYTVSPATYDGSVARFQNMRTGHFTMTGLGAQNGNPKDTMPQLVFRWGAESGCALVAMKMGDGRGWTYPWDQSRPNNAKT
ncbi:MAG: hypothetical protein JO307_14225 [Bryobacterales bacterium]|nr:hypothetical protein [Bryobacterales bacterium]MBV9396800.1 hypothetical protein [Bryobacterales bacterium]